MANPIPATKCAACRCQLCGCRIMHLLGGDGRPSALSFCPCCRNLCEHWQTLRRTQPLSEIETRILARHLRRTGGAADA